MAVPGTKRRLSWDALTYAYQYVVLADLAVMRSLTPSLVTLAPVSTKNRLIVARPQRKTGLQDPEQRLTLAEVLQAIKSGLERYYEDRGKASQASPEEIAEAFIELLKMGYIVIHYPLKYRKARQDAERKNDNVIRLAAKLVDEYIRYHVDRNFDIVGFNFKSYHGELARLAANASPLPSRYETVGFLALPAVLEPLPSRTKTPYLPREAREWLQSQCLNKAESEAVLFALENALERAGYQKLNNYQYQVVSEYFKRRKRNNNPPDIILTAPTGAGKTLIFTVIALLEILAARCRNKKIYVVLTYPRKTLARDQVEDIARILALLNESLEKRGLLRYIIFLWLRDGSSGVEKCAPDSNDCVELPENPEPIRDIKIPAGSGVSYATHYYDKQARAYKSQPSWLMDVKDNVEVELPGSHGGSPSRVKPGDVANIIVTNYDMLFKESLNLLKGTPTPLSRILREASIVVLDEAHIAMGGNQSIMVQAYALALDIAGRRPSIVLSSATLLERRLIDRRASLLNVVALEIRQGPSHREALDAFKRILGMEPLKDAVYIDYYATASREPMGWKLTLWTILYPSLLKKPMTALNESIVSILHALAAARARWDNGSQVKAIAFIEYKSSLRDVASELTERITLESGDVYDRVLLTRFFDEHYSKLRRLLQRFTSSSNFPQLPRADRSEAYREIADSIRKLIVQHKIVDIAGILWSSYFERFHALAPYASIEDHAFTLRCRIDTASEPSHRLEEGVKHLVSKVNRVLPPPPLGCDVWMEHMLLHASLAQVYRPWEGGQALNNYYKKIEAISRMLGLDLTRFIPIVTHHGDYTGTYRHLADKLLEETNPLIILATSTLEVGLNIPGIVATIHYILPREPGRIHQMIGRSGRRPETMRISQGIVILRQNAWESSKRVEVHAFRYFNEIASPPIPSLRSNPYYLARLCITMNQTSCALFSGKVDQSVKDVADYIVSERFNIVDETIRMARKTNVPIAGEFWCSPSFKRNIDSIKRSLGSHYRELSSALDSLHKACSGNNHVVILAAAENAYTLILDVLTSNGLQTKVKRQLENLLREIHKLRTSIYSLIVRSIAQALNLPHELDEIVLRIVYPRAFEVPGAGDLKSPAGRVILWG